MVKRLFVVVNPTQYLNAIEYAFHTGWEDDHLLIVTMDRTRFRELESIGPANTWSSVSVLDHSDTPGKVSRANFWKGGWKFLMASYRRIKPTELIVGNFVDGPLFPFVLALDGKHDRIVNLDDGTPTLNIAQSRREGTFYRDYHLQRLRVQLARCFYTGVFPPMKRSPACIEFFSMFALQVHARDRFRLNEYRWTRSLVNGESPTDEALFIGSHLVDRGIVSKKAYLQSLRQIRGQLESEGLRFVYVHHRSESGMMRRAIQEQVETVSFDKPLELVFTDRPRPTHLSSHLSSALFSLAGILPDTRISAYLFPHEVIMGTATEPKAYTLMVQDTIARDSRIDSTYFVGLPSA